MEESVWGDSYRGNPMNDRGLAVRLRAYEITSKNMRIGEAVCKGYAKCDFEDV
jgi:Protein of unknown function (DUF3631)